jgi:acetoin utilization deacetylase AcuC-like enzyme
MKLFHHPACHGARHEFETTRKPAWLVESLRNEPIAGASLALGHLVEETTLCEVHEPAYVAAVREGEPYDLACSQGFVWDIGLYESARASVGCLLDAARTARREGIAGAIANGFHHAKRHRGQGCCTFNGWAIAAKDALREGAGRVLLLDLDAHCGGGTHSLIGDDSRLVQLDISVSPVDGYRAHGANRLDLVRDPERYVEVLRQRLREQEGEAFGLCLYNAGVDVVETCDTGGLAGFSQKHLALREEEVFSWCRRRGLPVAFALGGGYCGPRLSPRGLVDLHRETFHAGARHSLLGR